MNKRIIKKIAVVGAIGVLIAAFWIFDLRQYLTLSYIKASREMFEMLYAERRGEMIAAYAVVYILLTSLSLPGAAVMTLLAGALFGLFIGTIVVSFASTIGATIACFTARFVLRDWIQNKFGNKLGKINEGIDREGAFYLFTLRLIPIFPFWLINLAIGITRMRLWTFYWVSQAGMLPGTIIYVNAGKELARIDSPSEIFSFRLIASFVLLGIFPITAKKLIQLYRLRLGKKHVEPSALRKKKEDM